jgi:CRISPR-associated protein Csy2
MLHRIEMLDDLLWQYHTDMPNNLYLCQQAQPETNNDGFF